MKRSVATLTGLLILATLLLLLLADSKPSITASVGAVSEGNGAAQLPLPTKVGQVFIIDDYSNKVTRGDLGTDYFMGNAGAAESDEELTSLSLSGESNGAGGGSLRITFDFSGQPEEGPFAGFFASLFGLTDAKVSLDGSGEEPEDPWRFPDYFLDTQDIYRDFLLWPDRSIEELRFDARLESAEDVTLKIELRDEADFDVFTRRTITNGGSQWQEFTLSLPTDFTDSVAGGGNTAPFDWRRVSVLTLVIERKNVGAGVDNPTTGEFLLDNLELVDSDGEYPDLGSESIRDPADGSLLPAYEDAFLDYVRGTSFLYFLDFASTDERTGGIIQDRSTFADLMSVGGVGFQLSSYVVAAERGYISRENAAARTRSILRVLHDQPQGYDRVGTIGYNGFFYHFLGIDGLRKQNFDYQETEGVDESLCTVEVSTIDTTLALAGAMTARQYFDGGTVTEQEVRSLADEIYAAVDWTFMLEPISQRFYLGWKPNEERDDTSGRCGRFLINDAGVRGQYSSKFTEGEEQPATIDYYTDEGLLAALLAIASPNPEHRVNNNVFFSMIREDEGGPFVKTYPGSLFTYQFGSVWLDTQALGPDVHPGQPVDYFWNTRAALLATRQYAIDNPEAHATLDDDRWGLSATEGPFGSYFAEAAPPAAIAITGECTGSGIRVDLEAEDGSGEGDVMSRGEASGEQTVLLHIGESRTMSFDLEGTARYEVAVRYSNDGGSDDVEVSIDGELVGQFTSQDTRPPGGEPGSGWNVFAWSGPIGTKVLAPGSHETTVTVMDGDSYGIEIDLASLTPVAVERPLEVGTVTIYGAGSSIVHAPDEALAALWEAQNLGMLHPRFGSADALNLDIADAVIAGCVDPDEARILRTSGPWAHFNGFAIDHGPMLALIDNHLSGQFLPSLFMAYPPITSALDGLFPSWRVPVGGIAESTDVDVAPPGPADAGGGAAASRHAATVIASAAVIAALAAGAWYVRRRRPAG